MTLTPDFPRARQSVGAIGVVRDALRAIGPSRGLLTLLMALSLLAGVLETAAVYLVGRLSLAVSAGDTTADVSFGPFDIVESLGILAVAGGVAVAALMLVAYPTALVGAKLSVRTINRARDRLIGAYLRTSWERRSQDREGHLQELIGQYTTRTERVVNQMTTIVVVSFSLLVLGLGALSVSPSATAIGIIGLVVLALLARPASKRVTFHSTRAALLSKELGSEIAQTARLSREIAAFDVGEEVGRLLQTTVRRLSNTIARLRLVSRLIPSLYLYGALALVVCLLGILSETDSNELAVMGPLVLLFVRGLGYGRQLQMAVQTSLEYSPYIDALEAEIAALQASPIKQGSLRADRLGNISFEHVYFEYRPGVPVLVDVSFELKLGMALGVVGPSGGGKTTLTELIMRLRQPTAGRVTVDDNDLANFDPVSWARLVSFVPQENGLIRGTVADNIRFYRVGYTDDEVAHAARLAHLHEEVAELPKGYRTIIGPGERGLSGGQSQRLGIARALLGRPELLVLDEPTSALDARSEDLVRQTLLEMKGKTTLMIIAHRPATLEVCDEVLRIEYTRAAYVGERQPNPGTMSAGRVNSLSDGSRENS